MPDAQVGDMQIDAQTTSSAIVTDSMPQDGLCFGDCGYPARGRFLEISSDIIRGLASHGMDIQQWCCGACARHWLDEQDDPSVVNSRRSEYQHGQY